MKNESCHRNANYGIVAQYSVWLEQTELRVKVRLIGNHRKVIVDIQEISPGGVHAFVSDVEQVAIQAAVTYGAKVDGFVLLRHYFTDREVVDLRGNNPFVNIRDKSFAFNGG